MPSDEFTPRELGLQAGHLWASFADEEEVKMTAEAGIIAKSARQVLLESDMEERLEEFDDSAKAGFEFREGFVHGVRAFIVENLNRIAEQN